MSGGSGMEILAEREPVRGEGEAIVYHLYERNGAFMKTVVDCASREDGATQLQTFIAIAEGTVTGEHATAPARRLGAVRVAGDAGSGDRGEHAFLVAYAGPGRGRGGASDRLQPSAGWSGAAGRDRRRR